MHTIEEVPFCKTYEGVVEPFSLEDIAGILWSGNVKTAFEKYTDYLRHRKMRKELTLFSPDLLVIIACTHKSFRLADQVMSLLPEVPAVTLVWDLLMDTPPSMTQSARRFISSVLKRSSHVEVISEALQAPVQELVHYTPRVENFFCCRIPSFFKAIHPKLEEGIQPVMVGNIWMKHMFSLVVSTIRLARQQEPRMKKLKWYCHPQSLKRLGYTPFSLPADVEYGGHYTGDELNEHLCACDICIIPFNGQDEPESDLARYSIPSRLSELCANGIPIFLIAGHGTAMSLYAKTKDCAMVSSPSNHAQLVLDLIQLAGDRKRREQLGKNARMLAEHEFEETEFKKHFFDRLKQVLNHKPVLDGTNNVQTNRSSRSARSRIILFGTGEAGRNGYLHLRKRNMIVGFCDNSKKKQGSEFQGLPVYGPDALHNLAFDKVVICSMYQDEIQHQLEKEIGIPCYKIEHLEPGRRVYGGQKSHGCLIASIVIILGIGLGVWKIISLFLS